MPSDLWSQAVTVARSEGAYRVARALRINFEGLKRRMAEASASGEGPATSAAPSAFVELAGAQILGASSRMGTIVELSDEGGLRLTVRLAPDVEVDLARLISVFRGRGQA